MSILGTEKAAILIMSLNEEKARQIITHLDSDELNAISVAMTRLGKVDSETVERVLMEFAHDLNQSLDIIGNTKTTEKFLRKVLDESKLNTVLERIKNANTNTIWEMISNLDDAAVAQFIKNEFPQTAALILTKIPSYKAARILKLLSKEYSVEVLRRMMYLDSVKVETLQGVEKVLENQLLDRNSAFNAEDNSKIIAEIFNSLSKADEQYFMSILKEKDPVSAEKIARMMLSFDDLLFIRGDGIQLVIKKVDNNTLMTALSGASEEIKTLFLTNMSQRVARMVEDEISGGAKYNRKDVFEAQTKILRVVKTMIADGSIVIEKAFEG